MRRLTGTVALLLLVVACDGVPTAPESLRRAGDQPVRVEGWVIYGPREVEPRAMWKRQYRAADGAIGEADGRLSRVTWFVADSMRGENRVWHAQGLWLEPHTIVIAAEATHSRGGVCHESVHEILQTTDHGHDAFDRCPFETTGGGDG